MIPLYDNNPTRTWPVFTLTVLGLNIAIFLLQVQTADFNRVLFEYGAIPAEIVNSVDFFPFIPIPVEFTLITSLFLHGDIFHLAGNMLYLWIFGNNVEDIFGHLEFVLFYLLCGLGATFFHIFQYTESHVPTVGASGAVSGLLAAYLVAFPRAKVYTLFWFVFFFRIIPLPAWLLIGIWFLVQILNLGTGGQVAWGAHVGGFVTGLALFPAFRFFTRKGKL